MILWNVRHAGSANAVSGVTAEEIVDGVKDGLWDTTDEVMGPDDSDWVSLETHPIFAQAMADYDPPPAKVPEDETRLDMNPLIDVALVLLIFFMLTTVYEELRKEFNPPEGTNDQVQGVMKDTDLRKTSVRVSAVMENGAPVFRVDDQVVAENELEAKFKAAMESSGQDKLAMDVANNVPWKAVVSIQDAAAGAKFQQIIRVVRVAEKKEKE